MKILGRAASIWREEGPRSLWFKAWGEIAYRRLLLIERDPGLNPPVSRCLLDDVECRRLAPEDFDAYQLLRPQARKAEFLRRLDARHQCFAVWKGAQIINAGWVGVGRCWIEYLDLTVELSQETGYLYEVFTAKQYRGYRVSSARFAHQSAILSAQGVRRMVAAIWPENSSVARSSARASFRTVGVVGYLGAGRCRYRYCRYDGAEPALWLV